MKKPKLQPYLLNLLKTRSGKIAKGSITDQARHDLGVTAETVGRRLRVFVEISKWGITPNSPAEHKTAFKLLNGGKVQVQYGNKHHAIYWYEPSATRTVRRIEIVNGVAKEVYETVDLTKAV